MLGGSFQLDIDVGDDEGHQDEDQADDLELLSVSCDDGEHRDGYDKNESRNERRRQHRAGSTME